METSEAAAARFMALSVTDLLAMSRISKNHHDAQFPKRWDIPFTPFSPRTTTRLHSFTLIDRLFL